jgi:SulP family sulfate permease
MRLSPPKPSDLVAGVSVALLLVPQSLAYAELAGVPAGVGLLVAAVAGLAAAGFASSPYLQTGPVAITALLVFGSLTPLAEPGSDRYLTLAAALAVLVGVIRLAIGWSRSGDLAYLMSEPVVVGFTAAAAAVIIATQIPDLFGVEDAPGGPIPSAVATMAAVGSWRWPTLAMGAGVVAFLLVARRLSGRVPFVIVAVVASILIARFGDYPGAVVGPLPGIRPALPQLPTADELVSLVVPALVIAIIGFGDVAAISRTYATATRTRWDADREFVAQGAANLASGLVGGFPVGGSFARTAVAFTSGARTVWTGAVASAAVLLIIPAAGLLAEVPTATLAAIIVVSVTNLADIRPILVLRRYSRQQFVISAATAVLTLALAPQVQWALIVGIVLSIGAHLRRELRIGVAFEHARGRAHLHPTGVLYFASAHRLIDQMRAIIVDEEVNHLVVHLDRLGRVDVTGAIAVRDFVREAHRLDVTVELIDATDPSRKILQRVLADDASQPDVNTLQPP